MTFLQGVPSLPARLVHHTGTMVRFTTAQLDHLPAVDVDCTLMLPDGAAVNGRFHRHPRNPYIGGPSLIRWIKSWVPYNSPTPVTVHQVGVANTMRLEIGAAPPLGAEDTARRHRVFARARTLRRVEQAERRRRSYETWERDPNLRRIALLAWGTKCQVTGCVFLRPVPAHIREKMVDVHHLNHVGRGGTDSPMNISVLCVVHHQLTRILELPSVTSARHLEKRQPFAPKPLAAAAVEG